MFAGQVRGYVLTGPPEKFLTEYPTFLVSLHPTLDIFAV
jgi:hypothetical protein